MFYALFEFFKEIFPHLRKYKKVTVTFENILVLKDLDPKSKSCQVSPNFKVFTGFLYKCRVVSENKYLSTTKPLCFWPVMFIQRLRGDCTVVVRTIS